jgi:hypothetical protein
MPHGQPSFIIEVGYRRSPVDNDKFLIVIADQRHFPNIEFHEVVFEFSLKSILAKYGLLVAVIRFRSFTQAYPE